jgi:GrpB-like predicted nucleotidyltransferase (UPF0157 family)
MDLFEREADLIRLTLGETALRIEHVGSTSIPGMAAKPILDMMVAVEELSHTSDIILPLVGIGYDYHPLDTVSDRLFFSKEIQPEIRTHHLNLTKIDSEFWKNQLLFRDHLKVNDELAYEYIKLKNSFVEYFARTNHLDREWKSEFVAKVLKMAKTERSTS